MGGELLGQSENTDSKNLEGQSNLENTQMSSKKRLTNLLSAVAISTASITWEALAYEKSNWDYNSDLVWADVIAYNSYSDYVTPKEIPDNIKKVILNFWWNDENWYQHEEYEKFAKLFTNISSYNREIFLDKMNEFIEDWETYASIEIETYFLGYWYPTNEAELIELWSVIS